MAVVASQHIHRRTLHGVAVICQEDHGRRVAIRLRDFWEGLDRDAGVGLGTRIVLRVATLVAMWPTMLR